MVGQVAEKNKKEKRKVKKFIRVLGIALVLALIASMAFGSIALADDPLVSVVVDTPSGDVTVTATGLDTSTWHPGSTGQIDTFHATGGFTASFTSSVGAYGKLHTSVNADGAYGAGATFQLDSYQDFNVLSANHINNVEGSFTAFAGANDNDVAMNLKTAGSMYVWSEATNPSRAPGLMGEFIYKFSQVDVNSVITAWLYQSVGTDGTANMHNSNIWGWSIGETGTLTTNYGSGTRDVSATGDGTFILDGAGNNELTMNGFIATSSGSSTVLGTLPAGGAITTIFNFVNGMTGDYSMTAR